MSEKGNSKERVAAEKQVEEAREILQQAQEDAAEAQAGLVAAVTRDVPRVKVEVLPNQRVGDPDSGKLKLEGEELEMDGPTAISLMQLGYVIIKGAV